MAAAWRYLHSIRSPALWCIPLVFGCSRPEHPPAVPVEEVVARLDSLRLVTHARVLSSDSMEGRANGSRGQQAARRYIVEQLRAAGVSGLPGIGYQQALPLTRIEVDSASRLVVRGPSGSRQFDSRQFHHYSGSEASFAGFAGRLVYLGRGGEALRLMQTAESLPEAVVVLEAGGGMVDSIGRLVAARGGAGILVALRSEATYRRYRNARGRARWFLRDSVWGSGGRSIPVLAVSPAVTSVLGLPPAADSASPAAPVELGRRVEVSVVSNRAAVGAANVVGMIPGSSEAPGLPAILFLAHYDHIGYGDPVEGDSLYNGFMDNAAGVSVLLETARVLATSAPRQPVVFLFTTAEEEGLLGSSFFAAHPPLPLERLGGVFNMDLPVPLAPPRSWYLESDDSVLVNRARDLLAPRGWGIAPLPLQQSSDHWTFAQYRVPAGLIVPGEGWEGVTDEQEAALIERWWKPHTPKDEWAPEFPASGMLSVAELAVRLSRLPAR